MRDYLPLCLFALLPLLASCSKDDDFDDSIFDTNIAAIDDKEATAPFDKWLYDNFVVPYNTEIQYRFNFPASNPLSINLLTESDIFNL